MFKRASSIISTSLITCIFFMNQACVQRKLAHTKEPQEKKQVQELKDVKKYDVKEAYAEEHRTVPLEAEQERIINPAEKLRLKSSELLLKAKSLRKKKARLSMTHAVKSEKRIRGMGGADLMHSPAPAANQEQPQDFNTEEYGRIYENQFANVSQKPLSTFSIDVDAASYSNIRRFLNHSSLPPQDAVRIEEMINYFSYDYPAPNNEHPFSIITELGQCPWNSKHQLLHIGLQGIKVDTKDMPPSNLVFLLDVSGSMNSPNKLPLLKTAFKLLASNLRKEDKVSIVVYAGAAGMVLSPTPGTDKQKIINALSNLRAGGSTAGGAGIQLAYTTAKKNYVKNGNNRIILATDGDFNIGVSNTGTLTRLIEKKREEGIFLTILGFGMGNYKDNRMESLADKGNGNYAYIDNVMEAKKVLVSEMGGTLLTIAKDVKLQLEFNPAVVQAYRLVGYENRVLADQDFNDDKKDAGEMGAGHTVTALYEIIPVGIKADIKGVDKLKYQHVVQSEMNLNEVLTVKFRYKDPKGSKSKLLQKVVKAQELSTGSENYHFSAAVAGFGMLLRKSEFKGDMTYEKVLSIAKKSRGTDTNGYRAEFISLVQRAQVLSQVNN